MRLGNSKGISILELLVTVAVVSLAMAGILEMLVQNSRINKSQQMTAQLQADARICLSMVIQKLRSAGWDPLNTGLNPVVLDGDLADFISEIEIFADLDADGLTTGVGEQITIRHSGDRITWRTTGAIAQPFEIMATNITNDSDGDGTPEPMFVPDSVTDPTRITVRITSRSPAVDPVSGEFIRYTMSSDVVLRKAL